MERILVHSCCIDAKAKGHAKAHILDPRLHSHHDFGNGHGRDEAKEYD